MGIKNLNSYFRQKCTKESIKQKHLSCYRNKNIVIDASIYLYRFIQENALIENMYLLISILKYYNIHPIFIFDGKPPHEKKESLKIRKNEKVNAKERFQFLKNAIQEQTNINILKEMKNEMEILKKKIVTLKEIDVKRVQSLMDKYGVDYVNADGEADVLCALFTINGTADYCLSDDTDMFLYNSPKVLRNISLINHYVLEYDTNKILNELDINFSDFQDIMIISGTDYNPLQCNDLFTVLKYYYEYVTDIQSDFYDYLIKNKNLPLDKNKLLEIKNMYNLPFASCKSNEKMKYKKTIDYSNLYSFMESNGFIFYNRVENNLPWKSGIKISA